MAVPLCEGASTGSVVTSDGVELIYEAAGPANGPVVLLIHGWSGSRRAFCRNFGALAGAGLRVVAYDQRFHGDSGRPAHGHHVARLAADLRELLAALELTDVVAVGASMGCAVIWSYVELFGQDRLRGAVFVDQAPLQNRAPGWDLGSKGCYDAASLASLQATLVADLGAIAAGNAEGCLTLREDIPAAVLELLHAETMRCNPHDLGLLMADHTQLDWRSVIKHKLTIPSLNCVGGTSGVFPPEGCLEVQRLAPASVCSAVFSRANHWLYVEQPDAFNHLLCSFVATGNEGRPALEHVQ